MWRNADWVDVRVLFPPQTALRHLPDLRSSLCHGRLERRLNPAGQTMNIDLVRRIDIDPRLDGNRRQRLQGSNTRKNLFERSFAIQMTGMPFALMEPAGGCLRGTHAADLNGGRDPIHRCSGIRRHARLSPVRNQDCRTSLAHFGSEDGVGLAAQRLAPLGVAELTRLEQPFENRILVDHGKEEWRRRSATVLFPLPGKPEIRTNRTTSPVPTTAAQFHSCGHRRSIGRRARSYARSGGP